MESTGGEMMDSSQQSAVSSQPEGDAVNGNYHTGAPVGAAPAPDGVIGADSRGKHASPEDASCGCQPAVDRSETPRCPRGDVPGGRDARGGAAFSGVAGGVPTIAMMDERQLDQLARRLCAPQAVGLAEAKADAAALVAAIAERYVALQDLTETVGITLAGVLGMAEANRRLRRCAEVLREICDPPGGVSKCGMCDRLVPVDPHAEGCAAKAALGAVSLEPGAESRKAPPKGGGESDEGGGIQIGGWEGEDAEEGGGA